MRTARLAALAAVLAFALAVAAAGCGTRGDLWTKSLDIEGPLPAAGHLVWLDRTTGLLHAIEPGAGTAPRNVPTSGRARMMAATAAGVMVLAGRGDAPVLDLVALPDGVVESLPLPGAYDRIAVSPQGTHAVLFYDPTAIPAPGGPAARNNNEIAVVDLAAGRVTRVVLQTESLAPRGVVFAPAGGLAAVVLDAAIALVELRSPLANVRVPLKLPGGSELTPEEALFSPDGEYLYVRARGSSDVLSIEISRDGGELGGTINFLFVPGASQLVDITVPAGGEFDRYVAALYRGSGTSLVALLDATGDDSRNHVATLSRVVTHVDDLGDGKLILYPDPTQVSSDSARYVAGWDPLTDRLDEDQMQGSTSGPPRFAAGSAFFPHDEVQVEGRGLTAALTGVTVSDDGLRVRVNLSAIGLRGPPTATAIDTASGVLYLGVQIPREDSGAAPGYDGEPIGVTGSLTAVKAYKSGAADSLAIGGLPLDEVITQVGFVGDWIYAIHPSSAGDVTVVRRDELSRASAFRYDGFLMGGLLDRKEVSP